MTIQPRGRSLIQNSAWNVGANLAYTALMLASAPMYLRYLGINQYGIFVLLNSVIAPLGLLNLGMGQAAVKYLAESIALQRPKEANGYLQATFLTTGILGGAGVIIVSMAASLLTARVFTISPGDQQIANAAVPWVAITWLLTQLGAQFTAVPTAMQRFSIVSTGTMICGAITLAIGLIALWLGGNLITVLEVRAVATLMTAIGWGLAARSMLPSLRFRLRITRAIFRKCMDFGAWQTVAAVGSLTANNADKALLGVYVSDAAVGIFAIPSTIVATASSLTSRAADVLMPAVSEIDSNAGRSRSFLVAIRAGWILSVISTCIMGCLVIMGSDLLRLYVGRGIAASCDRLLIIIALTFIAGAGSVAVNQYLLGIADTRRTAMIAVASGIVNVGGCMLLIPRYGLNGAAIADVIAIVLVRPIMQHIVWKDTCKAVPYGVFASYLYGPALAGIPVSIVLRLLRDRSNWECGWLGLAVSCIVCFVILAVTTLLFDRVLPDWKQRQSDSRYLLRYVWKAPQKMITMAAGR
jgi:O-antigen/teichoic acid export membrane protein